MKKLVLFASLLLLIFISTTIPQSTTKEDAPNGEEEKYNYQTKPITTEHQRISTADTISHKQRGNFILFIPLAVISVAVVYLYVYPCLTKLWESWYPLIFAIPVIFVILVLVLVFVPGIRERLERRRREKSLKEIVAKIEPAIRKLQDDFDMSIDNIDIESENPFAKLIFEAEKQYKKTSELIGTLRRWHQKYKGERCYFNEKANDRESWGDVFHRIDRKMKDCARNSEILMIFSSILQISRPLLSTTDVHRWDIEATFEQINNKGEDYESEVNQLRAKLKRTSPRLTDNFTATYWSWSE